MSAGWLTQSNKHFLIFFPVLGPCIGPGDTEEVAEGCGRGSEIRSCETLSYSLYLS